MSSTNICCGSHPWSINHVEDCSLPTHCHADILQPSWLARVHLQVLRVLLKLLETSRDAKTLAVGCHDLGCFITHYPAGKGLVTGAPPQHSAHGPECWHLDHQPPPWS
jgi:hypothetical protein